MNLEQLTNSTMFTPGAEAAIRKILPDPDLAFMPSVGEFTNNLSPYEQHYLEEVAKNYKLTPATLAFKLENKRIGPTEPLKWYPSPFLMDISLRIATGIAKGGARIIISAPPRHGKSRVSTIHSPLWVLENFADQNVVTTTYGADLSEDFARTIRDFIEDNPEDLSVRIRKDANRVAKFLTNKGGALTSIGLGGPITGRGANVLLIDDYIKQIKEALSPTYRQYVWDWFTTTAMTRLEPNASVIIVATRWHYDDLIGRIIREFGTKENGGDWDYIKFHAIARENDPLGRAPGEALFPQRYPVKTLMERKKLLGEMYYDAIFDQEPHETDSDLTNKSWIIKITPDKIPVQPMRLVRVWDFAGTEEAKADYTAGGLLAGMEGNDDTEHKAILLNMLRDQISSAKVEALVKKTAESDGPGVDIVICQETGSAGKAVVSYYQRNILKGYKVYGHYWNTGKVIVAQPWLAACEDGRFFMLEGGWNEDFLTEFSSFPTEGPGFHDDQCDVCSNGWIHLFGTSQLSVAWGRKQRNKPKAGDITKATPEEVARLAEIAAKQAEISPHQLLKQGQLAANGTRRGATFGRNRESNRKARIIFN